VFEHEPKVDQALRRMTNVVLTPHLGSAVVEVRDAMANIVVDNIFALLEGAGRRTASIRESWRGELKISSRKNRTCVEWAKALC